ncbi:FxsA protein [Oceanisphaera avium]|uniref:FxsA protein n=1 Tax=Oceanisphaera avium TaxID=1903694 RepID=A0A1Y0D1M7_9GAMM|nr:FxsA protein [Oceanisphaera avium]
MGKVFLVFVAATLLEIFVFIEVGAALGTWSTIALILLSAIVGLSLVRIQGFYTLMEVQRKISAGEPPAKEVLAGIMLALSGVLLVLPGFVSDILGLVLLLPPVRHWLVERWLSKVVLHSQTQGHTFSGEFHRTDTPNHERLSEDAGTTFEGDFERKDPEP